MGVNLRDNGMNSEEFNKYIKEAVQNIIKKEEKDQADIKRISESDLLEWLKQKLEQFKDTGTYRVFLFSEDIYDEDYDDDITRKEYLYTIKWLDTLTNKGWGVLNKPYEDDTTRSLGDEYLFVKEVYPMIINGTKYMVTEVEGQGNWVVIIEDVKRRRDYINSQLMKERYKDLYEDDANYKDIPDSWYQELTLPTK